MFFKILLMLFHMIIGAITMLLILKYIIEKELTSDIEVTIDVDELLKQIKEEK